ncbi:enoyl-CoA hydratase/isomerase family protein [Alcaligenaceae bacterium]|nr:enoyl-CoA hydratase/isomerase family protein [Alcaligenaceae bacterium]
MTTTSLISRLDNAKSCSTTVSYGCLGELAFIIMDSPPVNGLGDTIRAGIWAGLDLAESDAGVAAIVICGAGKMFCGGADIRQFNTPRATARPMLREVIKRIEQSGKPVIAAIHGMALGGGLELALGCHYRLAEAGAKLGLPEVNLGLIPGGGGTQRLTRLVGAEMALSLIIQGKPVGAAQAVKLGLADGVIEGDFYSAIAAFVQALGQRTVLNHPIIADMPPPAASIAVFEAASKGVHPKARNAKALHAVIDCIQQATRLPTDAGLDYERRRFDELVAGPESKSLRHVFFAEREALKISGLSSQPDIRTIKSVGIVGAGTMGAGIAMAYANAGMPVILFDRDAASIERGLATIKHNYQITASKGKLSQEAMAERLASIVTTLDISALSEADLVIEAVFEDMAVKKAVFEQLDQLCKAGAILATNTSRLSIDEIALVTKRPQDVIGLHFFSPANVMKLLEIVRGELTSPSVIASCMKMAQSIGKTPVLVGVCEGFVGNRMLAPYWREVGFLLEEGATPAQIDAALTRFGMAMGPLTMADLAGLDINWATRKRLAPTRPADLRYSKVADRICELGRFGQKTGAGYYRYENGSRTPIPDSVVDDLIVQCAHEAGIERRLISDEEIVERCMLALVNEGASIIEEGIAQRASDVDVVYVNGYGFPAWRGGPMFYAETLGIAAVHERVQALYDLHGKHWEPAPLLKRLAQAGASEWRLPAA